MKTLFVIAAALMLTTSVWAATATPSAGGQQLDTLKDRLASAATQLSQSQKRALYGTVKTTSVSTITVETATKDVKVELADNVKVAQVLKGKRTTLTTDDLAKGDAVVVFGDYDANLELLKAKFIFIQGPLPFRFSGVITDVNKKDYSITVATETGQSYTVDVETTTKNISWDAVNGTAKGAFSKFAAGDTVHVLGTLTSKTTNRVSAARILDICNITGAPTAAPAKPASPSATPKP